MFALWSIRRSWLANNKQFYTHACRKKGAGNKKHRPARKIKLPPGLMPRRHLPLEVLKKYLYFVFPVSPLSRFFKEKR
jgi:hypothetical protein